MKLKNHVLKVDPVEQIRQDSKSTASAFTGITATEHKTIPEFNIYWFLFHYSLVIWGRNFFPFIQNFAFNVQLT